MLKYRRIVGVNRRKGDNKVNTGNVTRIEVIDEEGRVFVRRNQVVEVHLQDDGRTMKIFIANNPDGTDTGTFDVHSIANIMDDTIRELYEIL